ncbi:MAG: ATP-binding protein [Armatimonadota bacterium]|nr:ATP-binding protein [Armatimonadota bacterium]
MSAIDHNLTIAVAAGKGGTGKTLIACSLAQALSRQRPGAVQVLDCDVEEPNVDILLHPEIAGREVVNILVPEVHPERCVHCKKCAHVCEVGAIAAIGEAVVTFHDLCSGCGACAWVCPTGAIEEVPMRIGDVVRGRSPEGVEFHQGRLDVGHQRSGPVTRAVKRAISGEMITITDAPPGTACPMQEAVEDSDYCVLVTEPTPFGLANLREAVETCRRMEIPCGVIVNRDRDGYMQMDEYIAAEELTVLLRVPERRAIAEAYSRGETLIGATDEWRHELIDVYQTIVEQAAVQPASPGA